MAQGLITKSVLDGIAAAIRAKLGVQTTYKPGQMAAAISSIPAPNLQSKNVTPGANQQIIEPTSPYNGLSSVIVAGDADLVAGNIKKDVVIFGITGSYEGGGGDTRTLIASWDFTGSTPLVDSIGGKSLTNNGITFSHEGAFFANYGAVGVGQGQKINLMIPLLDLVGNGTLYGHDIEVDVGAWNKYNEATNNYAIRLILVTPTNGIAYRGNNTAALRGWSIYDNEWSTDKVRSSAIEFSTVKLSFAQDSSGVDKVYLNGNAFIENDTNDRLASEAEFLMIGAPTDASTVSTGTCVGDIYIKAMRVYSR